MSRAAVTPFAIISGPAKSEKTYRNPWMCMSHRPGIRNLPVPSITRALLSGGLDVEGPAYAIRSPVTTTVKWGFIEPERTSITDTLVIATVAALLPRFEHAEAATTRTDKAASAIACALLARFRFAARWLVPRGW